MVVHGAITSVNYLSESDLIVHPDGKYEAPVPGELMLV